MVTTELLAARSYKGHLKEPDTPGGMVALIEAIRQKVCGVRGHDDMVLFDRDRMYVKCQKCGRETRGVSTRKGQS